MYWVNDGVSIRAGTSAKDRLLAAGVGLLLGGFVAAMIYRLNQDGTFAKPLEEVAVTFDFWLAVFLCLGFLAFIWIGLLSSRTVTLYRNSKVARIDKSALIVFRWGRDVEIREIRATRIETEMRQDISRNNDQLTHISWWIELVPESPKATWFGKPVMFWKGPNRQAIVEKAGEAHRLTGIPAFTPDRTPIW